MINRLKAPFGKMKDKIYLLRKERAKKRKGAPKESRRK
jgi:hypothetical protein